MKRLLRAVAAAITRARGAAGGSAAVSKGTPARAVGRISTTTYQVDRQCLPSPSSRESMRDSTTTKPSSSTTEADGESPGRSNTSAREHIIATGPGVCTTFVDQSTAPHHHTHPFLFPVLLPRKKTKKNQRTQKRCCCILIRHFISFSFFHSSLRESFTFIQTAPYTPTSTTNPRPLDYPEARARIPRVGAHHTHTFAHQPKKLHF